MAHPVGPQPAPGDTFGAELPYGQPPRSGAPTIVKPVLGVAATGVVAFLLWKALLVLLLPFVGVVLGFAFLVAKAVFIGAMVCIAIWLFRRWGRREEKLA